MVKIGKNREKLIEKIFEEGHDFQYYSFDDMMGESRGKSDKENARKTLSDMKSTYLDCDEKGDCHIHVHSNRYDQFKTNPELIKPIIIDDIDHDIKMNQRKIINYPSNAKYWKDEIDRLERRKKELQSELKQKAKISETKKNSEQPKGKSLTVIPDPMSPLANKKDINKMREEYEKERREKQAKLQPQPTQKPIEKPKPEPPKSGKIKLEIEGTCQEVDNYYRSNKVWDYPTTPDMDTFGNRLARKMAKKLVNECPNTKSGIELKTMNMTKHLKESD